MHSPIPKSYFEYCNRKATIFRIFDCNETKCSVICNISCNKKQSLLSLLVAQLKLYYTATIVEYIYMYMCV